MKSFLERPDCRRYICKSSLEKLCWAIAPKLCNSSEIFWLPLELIFARLLACKSVSVRRIQTKVLQQEAVGNQRFSWALHQNRASMAMMCHDSHPCNSVWHSRCACQNFSTQSCRRQLFFFLLKFIFSMVLIKTKTENKNKLRVITSLQFYILAFTSFALVLTVSN